MLYIFEKGKYPNEVTIAELDLPDDETATKKAIELDADYVWDVPKDRNPSSVWSKSGERR